MKESDIPQHLLDRFIRYTSIGTQSNQQRADEGIIPSSENQKILAKILVNELDAIGIKDITLTENFYILARIPASKGYEQKSCFGLSAHMDTSKDAPGESVTPVVHSNWDGSPIYLKDSICISTTNDSEISSCIGHTIITSDGTTLLGADDKTGIAGILTFADFLQKNPEYKHGPIEILFSPDEETGHGMDKVPFEQLASKAFYTVDGSDEGEIEAECFNAWKADIYFSGVVVHPGYARSKMVSAIRMAASFCENLPQNEGPETTDGYLGYFYPHEISGTTESAKMTVLIRDFDEIKITERIERLQQIAKGIEARFPKGQIEIKTSCQYRNMREKLQENPQIMEILTLAVTRAGCTPYLKPIRGGTDGSRLTEMGMPTPNIFTGGHNFHSRKEWASLAQMTKMVKTLIQLALLWGEK